MPNENNGKTKAQIVADNRIKMMADRLAILLTICNARDEDDWNPWALERTYDERDSMGDHIRRMRDYDVAKKIVRRWVEKVDAKTRESFDE
jgi:hypothetical protein